MLFRTHIAFGAFLSSLAVGLLASKWSLVLGLLAGSIVPDLDVQGSWLGKHFKSLSWLCETLFGHRHLLHSLFIPIAMLFLCQWGGFPLIGLGFLIGYIGHLSLDSLTKKGVHWLWPLKKPQIKGFLETGSFEELVFFWSFTIAALVILGLSI